MTNVEELAYRFRWQIVCLLAGIILAAAGIFVALHKDNKPEFEIVEAGVSEHSGGTVVVEVSGAVNKPGVYELKANARIEEAIILAGGVSAQANSDWVGKYLNRAAVVTDGQKIYIPSAQDEDVSNDILSENSLVNINTATQNQLESLRGIGPVYAQKIIDNRPYSNVDELLVKKVISQKIYDENNSRLTVY